MLRSLLWVMRFYRAFPHVVALLLCLTPLQAALHVLSPRLVGFTIDYIKTDQVTDHWLAEWVVALGGRMAIPPSQSFALAFLAMGVVSFSLYAYFQSYRAWMNLRLEWLFQQDAFDRITTKGQDFFNRFTTGDLITRMTDDVAEKLSWFSCSGIFRCYEALLSVIFIVLMMYSIDPVLTLWTAGPLPLLIVIFFISASILDERYEKLQKCIGRVNDVMEACFSGVRVVKAYVRESAQQKKFIAAAEARLTAEIASVKATTVIDSLYNFIWQFGVVIVLLAGGYKVLHSELSVGDLATFIYYVAWLVFPMFDVGQFLVKSRQSGVSIRRLMELDEVAPLVHDLGQDNLNDDLGGRIAYEDVSFSFPDSERAILRNVSLEIEPGHTVAAVGRIGCGKSWLVNLLPRLVDPTHGRIMLDGRNLRTYRLEELRAQIGYVPQEPVLFSDTVRNNILFGRDGIPEELLDWTLDVAQLKQEVAGFPRGMDTPIGTRGMSLSGGQKQRLALARALVGQPRILILDDCTSALDSRTEAALWDRLHAVMPDMTAILITHRPDTLRRVDRIFVLAEGVLIEAGTHAELLAVEGEYARIYKRYALEAEVTPRQLRTDARGRVEPQIALTSAAALAE